ncbi:prefoldin subunit 4-like [Rhynchocyon petersi]
MGGEEMSMKEEAQPPLPSIQNTQANKGQAQNLKNFRSALQTLRDTVKMPTPQSCQIRAATMKEAAAEDVNVTFEDQEKINKFSWYRSRISELKREIDKNQLQNLEDACDDIMMVNDNSVMIPYQVSDVFMRHFQEKTQEMLEDVKKNLQGEIDALESRVESIQRVLVDLKVQLYAKFGSKINLEADTS